MRDRSDIEQVLTLSAAGVPPSVIAERTGIPLRTVSRYRQRFAPIALDIDQQLRDNAAGIAQQAASVIRDGLLHIDKRLDNPDELSPFEFSSYLRTAIQAYQAANPKTPTTQQDDKPNVYVILDQSQHIHNPDS
jgi:hypothetical protein